MELFVISATTKRIGCVYGNNNNNKDNDYNNIDNNNNNITIQRLTSLSHKIILIACRFKIRTKKESVIT
ncbi:MAG: hypothetical protein M3275_01960 [Thermoproteota archaeon]|nr:hypothetical protein [Thermoproteota archaeon]